jgi:hypothetical protein
VYPDELKPSPWLGDRNIGCETPSTAPSNCCYGDNNLNQASTSTRRTTNREEAEKQVGYHRDQAERAVEAAAFFRENPAFDEFIQLVRIGAIQI